MATCPEGASTARGAVVGNTRSGMPGPKAVHIGRTSIRSTTPVQELWRTAADLILMTHRMSAVLAAMSIARIAHSNSRRSMLFAPSTLATDQLFQTTHFVHGQDVGVYHAAHQLLHRTAAETVDDLTHGSRCQASRGLCRPVHVSAAFAFMPQVPFLFQPSK